jgi:phosphonate transport system permease protein
LTTAAASTVRRGGVPPPPRRRLSPAVWLVIAVVVGLHVVAVRQTGFSLEALARGWHGMVDFVQQAVPPDVSWTDVVRPGLDASLVTLWIGLLGTTLSIPLAVVLAALGSRTTAPDRWSYQASRAAMSALRAVPEVVYALVFVTAVGLGPFPGVLALLVHNTGVMGKLWAEAMDEIDRGPVEALKVTGADRLQVILHAVLPSVLPQFLGLLLYRLDVNVRASLVLGLVGAGGIGFLIDQSVNLFRFDQMVTYIGIVLVVIIAVDQLSARIRSRIAA